MTTSNTNIIDIPKPKFGINQVVYIRESALNGYLEPQRVSIAYFDPDIGKYWYSFKFKKSPPVTQTVGDIIDLKTKTQIQILEDDLCEFEEALIIKSNYLANELNKTMTQLHSVSGGPEIDVYGSNVKITDHDLTPSPSDFTDFGEQIVDADPAHGLIRPFEIRNNGNFDLSLLGNPLIRIIGDDDFTVVSLPINLIPPGSTSVFRIAFKPLAIGRRVATILIASNDKNDSMFTFVIEGQGVSP
jgi:hypothetical protein